jgi:hypothetical protein
MTAEKLQRILDMLTTYRVAMRGVWIGHTSGGELYLEFRSQPDHAATIDYKLRKAGFIIDEMMNPGRYIYRPP